MREKATGETLTFLLRGEAILRLPVSSEHLSKETRIPSLCAVKRSVSQGLVSKGGSQQTAGTQNTPIPRPWSS